MKSVSLSEAKKKQKTSRGVPKQAGSPIKPGRQQAQMLMTERPAVSSSGLLAHPTSLAGRQAQILQLQRQYGNNYVQRLLAKHNRSSTLLVQRDSGGPGDAPELVIDEPLVINVNPKFYTRAERINKKYAARPPKPGWPYTAELKKLWSQGAYEEFADVVREFQFQNLGEKAADGILGPKTARALQSVPSSETEKDDPAEAAEASEGPAPASTPKSELKPKPSPDELATTDSGALKERYRQIQALLAQGTLSPDEQAAFEAEAELVKEALIDAITSESIKFDLAAFNNIQVEVPADGKIQSLTVRAAYFIHSGVTKVAKARKASKFSAIQKSLKENGDISLMKNYKDKEMASGFAVEYGKGTPNDVRLVIQEAINSGAIKRYALSKKKLKSGQSLGDLDTETLKEVTQQWIYDNGVGVDCSGFVVQTQFNAREKVRAELAGLGVDQSELPPELSAKVRNAASYEKETAVKNPSDLRPGDAWVLWGGSHIRIVTDVRQAIRKGKDIIEFDTAESAGKGTVRHKGQIAGTKRTKGLDDWGSITGTFHRL